MDDEEMIDYLIRVGEAVEYGERWTPDTTHEWWYTNEAKTERDYRMVATYHGGGNRGDDDEAEYAQRLLDLGRAVVHAYGTVEEYAKSLPPNITHVIVNGKPQRIRNYFAVTAPEGRY